MRRIEAWPSPARWLLLLALSALLSLVWSALGLPAALLLGPMVGAIVLGVNELRLSVPPLAYRGAQALIGTMVSAGVTPAIVSSFSHDWVLFCLVMAATLLGAAGIGWSISRVGLIPGASAVYGTAPGAASAMVLLSEAEGADPRLVAFMQYTRVLLVALGAALVARGIGVGAVHAPAVPWFGAVDIRSLAVVLALAILGQYLARRLRLQAWALLGPMLLLAPLHALGWLDIELPRWLLAVSYALLGWHIGLGFRRDALLHARRALPVVVGAALSLIAFCSTLAWCLARFAHVDGLTAYLATSPGGLDSIAVIAAATPHVDLAFVLALQAVRLLFVIALAPFLTRMVVRHSPHLTDKASSSNADANAGRHSNQQ